MKLAITITAALLAAASLPASATEVVGTTNPLNIRSGPRPFHPLVAGVAEGEPVDLLGCILDSTWCSVKAGEKWGWVDGDFLDVDPGEALRTVNSDRQDLGVPVVVYDETAEEFAGATIAGAPIPGPAGAVVSDPQADRPTDGVVVLIPSDHGLPVELEGAPPPEGSLPEDVTRRLDPGYDYGATSSIAAPILPEPPAATRP